MNQKLRFLMLALLCAVLSTAWGEEVTYDFTKIDGFDDWGSSYSRHVVEYDYATVTFESANKQTSNATISDRPVTKGQPVSLVMKGTKILTGVTFVCQQWGTKAQTITLLYSTDGGTTYNSTDVTSTNFTITNNNLPAGTNAVKITFSSSNQVGISSATINYTDASTSLVATPTFSLATGTYTSAQSVTISCATEGATIYYTTNGNDPTTNSSIYTAPITIEETTTLKAIAAKEEEGNVNVSDVQEATYTIIIIPTIKGYVIDFESSDISLYEDWTFYNIGNTNTAITAHGGSKYGSNINSSGNGTETAYIQTKEKVATPQKLTCYVSKASDNSKQSTWYIQVSSDKSTWTDVKTQDGASMSKGAWIEFSADLSSYTNVYVKVFYSGSSAIRAIDDINLTTTPTVDTPTFSLESGSYISEQSVEISCATDGATIYYTIDGTDPTTSSATYSSAISVSTTTTIKAMAVKDGMANSAIATAEYIFVTPYTVAEARAAIDAGTGVTGVYATGIVSEIVTPYNSEYGNISYNISDDGTTTADQLQVYRGKSYEGANFTSEDDIKVGDVVIVFGTLSKYNSIYQFNNGNKLVSLERAEPFTLTINSLATDGNKNYYATVSNLGYGNYKVPDGLEVSTITIQNRQINKTNTWTKNGVIPGDKAYYVVAEGIENPTEGALSFTFTPTTETSSVEITTTNNWLYPATTGPMKTSDTNYLYYKLTLDANNTANSVGFYFGENYGVPFEITDVHKAYLAVPLESGDAGISSIVIGDFTGISDIQSAKEQNDEVYTLSGVRVKGNLSKGIYIVNGKKHIIK